MVEIGHESVFHTKKRVNPFGLTPFLNKSGAGGDRTRDLLNAIQARSQLRHSPIYLFFLSYRILTLPAIQLLDISDYLETVKCKTASP
jgi:hypothetical protein